MQKKETKRLAGAGTAVKKGLCACLALIALGALLAAFPAQSQEGAGANDPQPAAREEPPPAAEQNPPADTAQPGPPESTHPMPDLKAPEHADSMPLLPRRKGGKGQEVVWNRDLPASLSEAQKSNKLVLVDIYTGWCGWCKKLDNETYTDPNVVQILKASFVCVKLDAEDGGPGESFARKYRVDGFPCIMILEPSGKLRGVTYGYRNAQDFSEILNRVMSEPPQT